MPVTTRAVAAANLNRTSSRLMNDHARLAAGLGVLLSNAATRQGPGGERLIPNTRQAREALSVAAWEQLLKPYYLGAGEALRGTVPQSPYARLLVDGVTGAVRAQVTRQLAMLKRFIKDDAVLAWLTGPRPMPIIQETIMDSFAQWLDPRGFKLADRIQRMAVEVRARVGRFLDYHIGQGTGVAAMTEAARRFLTTGERQRRPYGQQGSYPARLLARNEAIVAGGNATQNMSQVNPIVRGIQWRLSRADTGKDRCDRNARGGPNGDGVYSFELLPPYPDHIGCRCSISPVAVVNPAAVTVDLTAAIEERSDYAMELRGLFNDRWLTDALLSGGFEPAAARVIAAKKVFYSRPSAAGRKAAARVARPQRTLAQPAAIVDLTHRPGEAQLTLVAAHIDEQIADVAKAYGVTPKVVESKITTAFAKLTAENPIAIQFPSEYVDSLLTDGRFKTQFETGRGGGITSPEYRANAEQRGIGVPLDLDAKQRPVYGFLDVGGGSGARANVRDYGDLTFVFKDEVKSRATVTAGDSLFNFAQREVAGTPLLSPTRHSWDTSVEALYGFADGDTVSQLVGQTRYIEVQIQRGASLADVRGVVDRTGILSAAQRRALQDRGVEIWEK